MIASSALTSSRLLELKLTILGSAACVASLSPGFLSFCASFSAPCKQVQQHMQEGDQKPFHTTSISTSHVKAGCYLPSLFLVFCIAVTCATMASPQTRQQTMQNDNVHNMIKCRSCRVKCDTPVTEMDLLASAMMVGRGRDMKMEKRRRRDWAARRTRNIMTTLIIGISTKAYTTSNTRMSCIARKVCHCDVC